MALMKVTTVLLVTIASCYATYGNGDNGYNGNGYNGNGYNGNGYNGNGGGSRKVHVESPKILLDGPKIRLDNPKILVDRPSIHVKDTAEAHGLLGDDEPIILENDKPLYIRKSLHGFQPSAPTILIEGNHGHGGYISSHGHGYGTGKIVAAPIVAAPAPTIVAAPAPIVHDAILVRRPIHVAKELVPTQDHLERAHFDRIILSGGYHHAHIGHPTGTVLTAIPISKGIQENTVVYERAPIRSVGHGLISYRSYHAPSAVAVGPTVIDAGHGYGKDAHHGYGSYKKY